MDSVRETVSSVLKRRVVKPTEQRRAEILDAALQLFSSEGFHDTTMEEVANAAGVAKGTIYLYFRDRDELVERAFEGAIAALMEQIDGVLRQDLPFDALIRAIMAAKISFFTANREFFRLYLSLRLAEGPATRQRRRKQNCHPQYRVRAQRLAEVLKSAMERGEIRETDPYRLAVFIIEGSTAVILERLSEDSSPSEADDVEFVAGLVLDGVRKRSGS